MSARVPHVRDRNSNSSSGGRGGGCEGDRGETYRIALSLARMASASLGLARALSPRQSVGEARVPAANRVTSATRARADGHVRVCVCVCVRDRDREAGACLFLTETEHLLSLFAALGRSSLFVETRRLHVET